MLNVSILQMATSIKGKLRLDKGGARSGQLVWLALYVVVTGLLIAALAMSIFSVYNINRLSSHLNELDNDKIDSMMVDLVQQAKISNDTSEYLDNAIRNALIRLFLSENDAATSSRFSRSDSLQYYWNRYRKEKLTSSCSCPSGPKGQPGTTGAAGSRGKNGYQGMQGKQGYRGLMGLKGDKGSGGYKGIKGDKGIDVDHSKLILIKGPKGAEGLPGRGGQSGPKGQKGFKGDAGAVDEAEIEKIESLLRKRRAITFLTNNNDKGEGDAYHEGLTLRGPPGLPGSAGPKGEKGSRGSTGIGQMGASGIKGDLGRQGVPGYPGQAGATGPMGQKGPIGPKGDKGYPGVMGMKGDRGDKGRRGKKGDLGSKGVSGIPGLDAPCPLGLDGYPLPQCSYYPAKKDPDI